MNAMTARKCYWEQCLAWMCSTLVKGELKVNMVTFNSHEDALENILGTTDTGPWRNHGAISSCGGQKISDPVALLEDQKLFMGSLSFVVFNPGKIVCMVCSKIC